jgi:serine protease Do
MKVLQTTAWLLTMALTCGWLDQSFGQDESNAEQSSFVQTVIDDAQPKIVKVFGAGAGRVESFATGFIVSADGKILTSQGVFLDGKQVRVVMADGRSSIATVLRRDRRAQIALLKIAQPTPDFFDLKKESNVRRGDWVVAICNAFKVADKAEPISATLGVVSLRTTMEAKLTERDFAFRGSLLLLDAITSNPGAAGGPVVSVEGELVGMVGKIINSSETNTRLNYAVPSDVLYQFVNGGSLSVVDAKEKQPKGAADFGIVLFRLGGRKSPAYVDRVKRGSPAAIAKLKTDDMVVSLDGQKIGTVKDFESVMQELRIGEEVTVGVKRGIKMLQLRMTPIEKKASQR